jgi:predicted 3-demethylubiquinone-9 3-methyltransferase (glyoxalase superfamily)
METQNNATLAAEQESAVTGAQRITPFLWFNGNVDEAVNFYAGIFDDAKIVNLSRLPAEVPGRPGKVAMATFRLNGLEFYALDGGPMYSFTPAISFYIKCETQQEVDHYWYKLSEGGATNQCGWLTDKFGVCWQVVPNALSRLMGDPNPVKARNVMNAMMQMTKLDIAGLQEAYDKE